MNRIFKRIITMALVLALFVCGVLPVTAEEEELYLSDLRLIYAEDYSEALDILEDSEFADYELLDENLNEDTGEIGVFLAYKVTTDIEDAITDIAVMQMDGGYREGNYQELIKQSYSEYKEMGENYLVAIDYFNKAYDAGHYLADIAYRQLNFYYVKTEGITNVPSFEGERIGDIFYSGIESDELATMFMEGNVYALDNIRSLISMGVSYNENGKTYLENVAEEAKKLAADSLIYAGEDYNDLAALIAPTIVTFRDMFKELEAVEDDLDYSDDEDTDLELQYMEYKVMAEMMREVEYPTKDSTLYDFCKKYTLNKEDYSSLYPLVAALNEGQEAMTRVAHFYDVVRYSMTLESNEDIETELVALDEEYGECPFNVYTGVDRTIYHDTFALTSEAYRADAFTEDGLSAALFGDDLSALNIAATVVGSVGACMLGVGLARYGYLKWGASKANNLLKTQESYAYDSFSSTQDYSGRIGDSAHTAWSPKGATNRFYDNLTQNGYNLDSSFESWRFEDQMNYLNKFYNNNPNAPYLTQFSKFNGQVNRYVNNQGTVMSAKDNAEIATQSLNNGMNFVYGMCIVGGIMMLSSAITLGIGIINYYNPDYSDIPTSLVDLIETTDGDRYIKYDVVYEAETREGGDYAAADLNAFEAQRWNALYFTKSYEAGKPLLADEFVVSYRNNVPEEGYTPVHRFGEIICFDLNKYNYNDDQSIYLSVKQSENQKAAVADVPELVGSMFSTNVMVLAGGLGMAAGAGATIGMQKLVRKKKSSTESKA